MPKINIKVTIKSANETISRKCIGIYQDGILKYREDDKTKMVFNYNKNELKRETQELLMKFNFDKNILKIRYKELNMNLDYEIKTNKIKKEHKDIEIKYILENEEFIYRIEAIQ